MKIKNVIVATIMLLFGIGAYFAYLQLYISQIEYLVFEGGGNRMEEGKLYIRDKKKVQKIAQMFVHNADMQHACGYWYSLTMYDKNNKEVFGVGLNGECDEFWFRDTEIQTFISDCRKKLSKTKTK